MKLGSFFIPILAFMLIATALSLGSCSQYGATYPKYRLVIIKHIPDSLKHKHAELMTSLIKSGSSNVTDSDDLDDALYAARNIANDLYMGETEVLRRRISDIYETDIHPKDFNEVEQIIYNELLTNSNTWIRLSKYEKQEQETK